MKSLLPLPLVLALALAGCSSDSPAGPSPESAKTSVERAAGLQLTAVAIPDEVADMVGSTAPKSARLIRKGNVMVVYAAAGSDRGPAVQRAVKEL